jgi:hypothetical protein
MHRARRPATCAPSLLLLSLLPLASGCSFEFPMRSAWVTDHGWVQQATAAREAELSVPEGTGDLHVTLSAQVEAGFASWSLVDPAGTVRWTCRAGSGGQVEQQLSLSAVPGRWLVRRDWRGFSGSQHLVVQARSDERLRIEIAPVSIEAR